ncbi:cysteine desulfurase NifS [methanogenic archaeon mixed culture ISO4-G1]|nr:cysteine desulfurase NifS [methanogenic archaeon mixed culture ISO4-G1]
MENVYLDNAATTPLRKEALEAMMPYFIDDFANPSSIHSMSRSPRAAVKEARATIAKTLNAEPEEIFFTSGGTESDNWALISTAQLKQKQGKHIIVSTVEHHAILETADYLKKQGFEVTKVGVDSDGVIRMDELESAIRPDTVLISVMTANNEIGTIQPVEKIGKLAHDHGILFHTDAVQAYCHIPIDVQRMNIDMLSVSGHKFGGPKGIGFLYVNKKIRLPPFMHGGEQENGRRAGTTNVPGIVGMAKAAEIAHEHLAENIAKMTKLRDHYIERIEKEVPYCKLNGHRTKRLPGNANFSFHFVEGESLLMSLGMKGVCISTGSACASGSLDPSHVLMAIGVPHEIAHGSVRVSLSEDTTLEQIDYAVDAIKATVATMRSLSPLYDDFVKSHKEA